MGIGLAIGTGVTQSLQQRRDEGRAEEAFNKLKDREMKDWKFQQEEGIDFAAQKEQAKLKVQKTALEEERDRRLEFAISVLPPTMNQKVRDSHANMYAQDSEMSSTELMQLQDKFGVNNAGDVTPLGALKRDRSMQRLDTIYPMYKGSSFYEFVQNEILNGDDLGDITEKFVPVAKARADGTIDYVPTPTAIATADIRSKADRLKGFESKAITEASASEILENTLGLTRIWSEASQSHEFTTKPTFMQSAYVAKINTLAERMYIQALGGSQRLSAQEAVIQAKVQLEQQYGPITNIETNVANGVYPDPSGGTKKIEKNTTEMIARNDAGASREELLAKYGSTPESLTMYMETMIEAAEENPALKGMVVDIHNKLKADLSDKPKGKAAPDKDTKVKEESSGVLPETKSFGEAVLPSIKNLFGVKE